MQTTDRHRPDLLANFWTLAGDHRPGGAPQVSCRNLCARIEAAAQAGFTGIGFGYADLVGWTAKIGLQRVARTLRDHRIRRCEFEFVPGWWDTGSESDRAASAASHLCQIIPALGVDSAVVKCVPDRSGMVWPTEVYANGLGRLAQQFSEAGVRLGLEFVPFSDVSTPARALDVVTAAGPGIGIVVDAWHVARGAVPLAELTSLPANRIVHAELCDGDRVQVGDPADDARDRRRLCGEGSFDLPGFVAALRIAGYRGPFGVEIVSVEQRRRTLVEASTLAYRTALAQFAHANDAPQITRLEAGPDGP